MRHQTSGDQTLIFNLQIRKYLLQKVKRIYIEMATGYIKQGEIQSCVQQRSYKDK